MPRIEYGEMCPATIAFNAVAGKWKLPVVARLFKGSKRFSELKEDLEGISSKVLTGTLRELEEDGIVERRVVSTMPVRVEYGLSDIGYQLKPVLLEMKSWGEIFMATYGNNENKLLQGNIRQTKHDCIP